MNVAPIYTAHEAMRESSHHRLVCRVQSVTLIADKKTVRQGEKINFVVQASGWPAGMRFWVTSSLTTPWDFSQMFAVWIDSNGRGSTEAWCRDIGTARYYATLRRNPGDPVVSNVVPVTVTAAPSVVSCPDLGAWMSRWASEREPELGISVAVTMTGIMAGGYSTTVAPTAFGLSYNESESNSGPGGTFCAGNIKILGDQSAASGTLVTLYANIDIGEPGAGSFILLVYTKDDDYFGMHASTGSYSFSSIMTGGTPLGVLDTLMVSG